MKKIIDIAKSAKVQWGTIARAIDDNFGEGTAYSQQNRQHLNGDLAVTDADKYPYLAIYIDNPTGEYNELNMKLNDINTMATTKYNGHLRFILSGVRIDVINRVLSFGNKTTSQLVFGPLQPNMSGALEYNGKEDQILRRQYKNSSWTQWEVIRPAEVGFRSSGSQSERFNDPSNVAAGEYSHAEGQNNRTEAGATAAHVEGGYNVVNNAYEHACGRYNASKKGKTLFSVGVGNISRRFNALEVDIVGNCYVKGVNGYDGTNADAARSLQTHLNKPRGEFIYVDNILTEFTAPVDVTQYVDISIEDANGAKLIMEKALRAGIFGVSFSHEGQDNSSIPLSCSLINEVASNESHYEFLFLMRGVIYQFELLLKPDGKWFTVADTLKQRSIKNIPVAPAVEVLDLTGLIAAIGGSDIERPSFNTLNYPTKESIKRTAYMGYWENSKTESCSMPLSISFEEFLDGTHNMTITAKNATEIITLKFEITAEGAPMRFKAKESSKVVI